MQSLICAKPLVKARQKFGRLTVLGMPFYVRTNNGNREGRVVCECSCGQVICTGASRLKYGRVNSCGCFRGENVRTHRLSPHPAYRKWASILHRCYDSRNKEYKNYGGRGITVCEEWRSDPAAFCEWALENGYRKGLQIDRIDNNGNYEPGNCHFTTSKHNSRNKRNNRLITANGKTQCLSAWAEETGLNLVTIHYRLKRGWAEQDAVKLGS